MLAEKIKKLETTSNSDVFNKLVIGCLKDISSFMDSQIKKEIKKEELENEIISEECKE
jgi:hypothetical protein